MDELLEGFSRWNINFCIWAGPRPASPALATELQETVKRVTAPYKYPREIEFVDALPKTISGKIRRVF
jgi:acyl-coenzyme A synthetase/AMP-(fatty) acid ligase